MKHSLKSFYIHSFHFADFLGTSAKKRAFVTWWTIRGTARFKEGASEIFQRGDLIAQVLTFPLFCQIQKMLYRMASEFPVIFENDDFQVIPLFVGTALMAYLNRYSSITRMTDTHFFLPYPAYKVFLHRNDV